MEPEYGYTGNDEAERRMKSIATGQKMVIYALLLDIVAIAVVTIPGVSDGGGILLLAGSLGLRFVAFGLGVYGIWTIGTGFGWLAPVKVVTTILLFIPLVNLITLLVLNGKATRVLKDAGYKVGLAGAYK